MFYFLLVTALAPEMFARKVGAEESHLISDDACLNGESGSACALHALQHSKMPVALQKGSRSTRHRRHNHDVVDDVSTAKSFLTPGVKVRHGDEEVLGIEHLKLVKQWVEQLLIKSPAEDLAKLLLERLPNNKTAEVQFMLCEQDGCTLSQQASDSAAQQIQKFKDAATSLDPVTDKVWRHSYQTMYGVLLMPLMEVVQEPKMLEIGLGCDMGYGPGASVGLWKKLFPHAELWFGEYNGTCVTAARAKGQLQGINTVVGDQGNMSTVRQWIKESGGEFDVVIDDGGHLNKQIRTSFETLWPAVKPGGFYFLEDLHVGRLLRSDFPAPVMSDMIQAWVEQLLTGTSQGDFPLPSDTRAILCQHEACVIMKSGGQMNIM
ncbi:unnamed protein product [Polarella glacialis]|uniref:Uncharacterized protein n=1 Tax=Polarella glacialis TaxID=89957 RepID=A0A813EQ98_POLGL|nr:unnamed protein product [Polarella glacialis]